MKVGGEHRTLPDRFLGGRPGYECVKCGRVFSERTPTVSGSEGPPECVEDVSVMFARWATEAEAVRRDA